MLSFYDFYNPKCFVTDYSSSCTHKPLLKMKKLPLFITALILSLTAFSQTAIKIEDISKHVGDSVKVCTTIYGGIFLERAKNTPTFLNAGGSYPNAPLTVVIWAAARATFTEKPEVFYKDKNVCIYGKVELYKEKPQLVVYGEGQLIVVN